MWKYGLTEIIVVDYNADMEPAGDVFTDDNLVCKTADCVNITTDSSDAKIDQMKNDATSENGNVPSSNRPKGETNNADLRHFSDDKGKNGYESHKGCHAPGNREVAEVPHADNNNVSNSHKQGTKEKDEIKRKLPDSMIGKQDCAIKVQQMASSSEPKEKLDNSSDSREQSSHSLKSEELLACSSNSGRKSSDYEKKSANSSVSREVSDSHSKKPTGASKSAGKPANSSTTQKKPTNSSKSGEKSLSSSSKHSQSSKSWETSRNAPKSDKKPSGSSRSGGRPMSSSTKPSSSIESGSKVSSCSMSDEKPITRSTRNEQSKGSSKSSKILSNPKSSDSKTDRRDNGRIRRDTESHQEKDKIHKGGEDNTKQEDMKPPQKDAKKGSQPHTSDTKSLPVPTKLQVKVKKTFEKVEDLSAFLRKAVGGEVSLPDVLPGTMIPSRQKTQCQMLCASKSSAQKLRQKLSGLKQDGIAIHCKILYGYPEVKSNNAVSKDVTSSIPDATSLPQKGDKAESASNKSGSQSSKQKEKTSLSFADDKHKASKTGKNKSSPVPTKMAVTVDQIFANKEELSRFLKQAIGNKIPFPNVLTFTVNPSRQTTQSEIVCASKSSAHKLREKLYGIKQSSAIIRCKILGDHCITSSDDSKENQAASSTLNPNAASFTPRNYEKSKSAGYEDPKSSVNKHDRDRKHGGNKEQQEPIRISVTVDKIFKRPKDLSDFLKRAVGDKTHIPEILPKSMSSSKQNCTYCTMITKSKNSAYELKDKLNGIKHEGVSIHCEVLHNISDKANLKRMETFIRSTQSEIMREKLEALKDHHKKQILCENKLLFNSDVSEDLEDQGRPNEGTAFAQGLEEIKKQRVTFLSRMRILEEKNSSLDANTSSKSEMLDLLREVRAECSRLTNPLPIYASREEIVERVSSSQVSIIIGETGSGKSTQIIQYLHDAGFSKNKKIVCAQPRKVAALSLAKRVAQEMGISYVGGLVGYSVGGDKKMSAKTRMLFSTDSCLLNECLKDPLFSNYSCIIIDEAHERCLYTDLLIGMIKACLPERPDLKIVITSATFDPQVFIDYFDCELELRIGGTSYEVVVEYDETGETEDFERYEQRAVSKAMEIHKTEEQPGDILIFLTSPVEIMRCIDEFEKQMGKGGEEEDGSKNFKCLPLHGQLSPDLQMKVFEPLPAGTRKVVFATNCAETSLTIDGIRYVIDSGLVKEVRYNPKKNISLIDICPISQSSANQRKGRAGRTASGKCYRLYSEEGYERMASDTDPEILRVPLGQAVLKLAAMGIDVRTYDFVQSPQKDAIDCAVTTLHGLQALTPEGSITPIGEWLASLPTDPKEGYLIHEGNKHNLLYDTIVLAALISNGSTMFYRGLTEKEEQVAAKSKNLYASPNGDIFSWLEVYKKWLEIPKEKQSKWCQEHGINYKVMGYIKKYVSEVIAVLKKKHKIEVPRTFATSKSSQLALQKLVFETYMSSLCQYLGHRRAGYKSLITYDKFQIHPSSTLNALNVQPVWIIYTELTRTSRDFIKGITLVEEEWIIEAVEQGKLSLDIEDLKQQRIVLVQTEELGTSVFNHMKGPRYSRLRDLEKELKTNFGMDNVVVDADGEFQILNVYSSSSMNKEAQDYINEQKSKIVGQLTFEEDAVSFFDPNKKREEIYRVHLGQGGMVRALFMPNQSDEIIIKRSSLRTSEEEMRKKFKKFGQITECRKGGVQGAWGTIRYATVAEAQKAVENTRHDEDDAAVLNCKTQNISKHETYKVKLSWVRRPIKAAFIDGPEEEEPLLVGKRILLDDNNSADIQWSKGLRTHYILIDREDIEEWRIELQVMKLLNYTEDQKDDVWVTMERERARVLTRKEKEDLEEILMRLCEDLMPDESFSVEVVYPNQESVHQNAYIHFENATGYQSCKKLVGKLNFFGKAVAIDPKLKTNIRVSENVMNFCTSQFEDIKTVFEKMDIRLEREEMQEGGYLIEINSSNADHLEKAKDILMRFSQGNKVECGEGSGLRNILKPSVKRKLNEIEKDSQTLIIADNHNETLHIYGDTKNVRKAKDSIKILAEHDQNKYKLRSPGTLKALMTEFKNLNEDLAERFALTGVSTDFKQQVLFLFGPPETVRKACDFIADMETNLPKEFVPRQVEESPHCVVCLHAIEESVDLYRLEACGHSYCRSCIKLQVTFSVDNNHFPITCAEQGCNQPLVWKDFLFFIRRKWTTREQLTKASLNVFVRANRDKHRYCITPDCEMIYAITNDVEGKKFECPACRVHICSSCHTPFHPGVNCKGETPDNRLKKWMKEDPKTRKHCPKCNAPIEKRVGCEHVVCKNCKVDFCWQCLEMFSGDQECYKHIREQHEPL